MFDRDGERCSYLDAQGNRCPSSAFLQLEHRHPQACGGSGDEPNIAVYCGRHNRWAAEEYFGREFIAQKRNQRRSMPSSRAAPPANDMGPFAQLERGLKNLGYRASEAELALTTLRSRLEGQSLPPIEQLVRDALAIFA